MSDFVNINLDDLAEHLTCPLCGKIWEEATNTGECLDTFCRKCIYQKLENGGDCCPKCETGLGSNPLEKLRPNQTKQTIRNLLFPLQSDKPKGRKMGSSSRAQGNSAQRVDKPKNTQHGNGTGQVRFCLLASKNKEGNSLPQILCRPLRLEDGHLPVPYFQKYLKKELNLKSETEVEITIDDQLLSPTLPVSSLIDQWQQKRSLSYSARIGERSSSGNLDIFLHYRPSHLQEQVKFLLELMDVRLWLKRFLRVCARALSNHTLVERTTINEYLYMGWEHNSFLNPQISDAKGMIFGVSGILSKTS